MKKNLCLALFLLLLSGCSQSPPGEIFGGQMAAIQLKKDLPRVSPPKIISSKALSSEYQQKLDMTLQNQLVKVDSLQLLQNGDSYLPLLRMIENTKKYFYMNVLSFSCDEATEELVVQLEARAQRGMDIRLIVNKGYSFLTLSCLKR